MNRALIYTRVSLDATGEGRSVERQLEACRAVAVAKGYEVVAELSDNSVSAYGEKSRPGWEECLKLIGQGEVDAAIAWHMDRMTRSMVELERVIQLCERTNVRILTATGDIDLGSDVGRMVARILGAVARAEVERKAARQRLANAQRASKGLPIIGSVTPFGYTKDQMHIEKEEAAKIRKAAKEVLEGKTLAAVAREWEWSPQGVRRLLLHPRYAGVMVYKGGEVGPAKWPAILSLDTHLALRSMLTSRQGRTGVGAENLLSGIAVCGVCNGPLRASQLGARGKRWNTYACHPRHVNPPRERADKAVQEAMVGLLAQPVLLEERVRPVASVDSGVDVDVIRRRLTVLTRNFAEGVIDEAIYEDSARSLKGQIAEAVAAQNRVNEVDVIGDIHVGTQQVVREWSGLTLERKRLLISKFLHVVALRKAAGATRWDPKVHLAISRRD